MGVVGIVDPVPEELARAAFPPSATSPTRARQLVRDVLRSHGRDSVAADAALLVSELATNAVVHARGEFSVAVMLGERSVRVEVHDPTDAPPVRRRRDSPTQGGQGIHIVATLADRWGIEPRTRGGKSVWFELDD